MVVFEVFHVDCVQDILYGMEEQQPIDCDLLLSVEWKPGSLI